MKAMVLLAGVGSRLDPLTSQIPKPLVPIVNTPVVDHILGLLRRHQLNDVIANLHYLPEKIERHIHTKKDSPVKMKFRIEKELSGDAGGVRFCRDYLGSETFIVLMGDLLTDADLTKVIQAHKYKKALASIALKRVPDVSHFGVATQDKEGLITGFQEKPSKEEALSDLASTGIYVLEPEIFKYIPESGPYGFGRELFPTLVKAGLPILGVEITDYWSDVGTIDQYRISNFDALTSKIKVRIPGQRRTVAGHAVFHCEGAVIDDNCKLEGNLLVGRNSIIEAGVSIRGSVIIGDDCVIERGAQLENTVVWANSKVNAGASLKDSVIGSNCAVDKDSSHLDVTMVAGGPR